jgi:hypothetical protein
LDLVERASATGYRHPWELSRRDSLLRVLAEKGPWRDVADVGAGDGFFINALRETATGSVYAIDIHYDDTGQRDGIVLGRHVEDLPDQGLDCAVMMDVLEHVEDERPFLAGVRAKLRTDGAVLVTVPAFQWLFSAHDTFLRHFRRYSRSQLRAVLELSGLHVEECFYFYATLLGARAAAVALARIVGQQQPRGVGGWRLGGRHVMTVACRGWLSFDFRVCRTLAGMGLPLPGLSVCAICRNTSA